MITKKQLLTCVWFSGFYFPPQNNISDYSGVMIRQFERKHFYFFFSSTNLTPPRLHLTVTFPPRFSLLCRNSAGGKGKTGRENNILHFILRAEEEKVRKIKKGVVRGENWSCAKNSIQWPILKPEKGVTVREGLGGRTWMPKCVLFTKRKPKEKAVTEERFVWVHHQVWVCMSMLVVGVRRRPARI